MIDKIKQGDTKCGDGPVLTYGPETFQNNLLDLIIKTEKNKIPFQERHQERQVQIQIVI